MNKTAKNSVIYLGGTIIVSVLGFASTMLLTRILSNQVYAMYGLLSTFCTAVTMFISFGFDSSYMRFYYNHGYTQKAFMIKCLKVPIIIFIVFSLIVLEPSHKLINYLFESNLSAFALMILLGYTLFFFLHRFSQLTARMEERALNYVVSNIIAKSGFIVFILISYLIWKNISFEMVILSFALSSLIAVIINLSVFFKVANKSCSTQEANVNNSISDKELIRYGFPYMVNDVLVLVIPVIEKLIIRDLAGWEVLSIYTAAATFQTIASLVSNTVVNIWNPIVFKHCENEKHLKPILHDIGFSLTIIIALGTSFCILCRRWLILLLGDNYYDAFIIAPAILFGALFNVSATIYGSGINIRKKTIHFIVSPFIQIVVSIILCYITVPALGLVGVGISTLISITLSRIYRIVVGMKLFDTGVKEGKVIAIYCFCFVTTLISLFFTSLVADVAVSISLFALTIAISLKDIQPLLKNIIVLIKGNKEKQV